MRQVGEQLSYCITLKNEGCYEDAMMELKAILEADSDNVEAHRQLGLVYGFLGMFGESLEELHYAVTLDATNMCVRNDLALTYCMLGMSEEARAQFEFVLSLDPDNEIANKNIIYLA